MSQDVARVEEVADGIYQLHVPVPGDDGSFSFNQYLIVDEEPLLFHTGPRRFSAVVHQAIARILPVSKLRHIGYSHCESDECGGMAELLSSAPQAHPVTGAIGSMLNTDLFDRPTRALQHQEALKLGRHVVKWLDAPHLPHAWECGYLYEETTGTLLCGDIFTQPGCGAQTPALTTADVLEPSEIARKGNGYFSLSPRSASLLDSMAALKPSTLACMHGSAFSGNGAALLTELGRRLSQEARNP